MKLSKASAALAYLVTGSAPTIVVAAASAAETTVSKTAKLRGRELQGNGMPSDIVHEDDNMGDCTIIAQENLMIPKEGGRDLQYGEDNELEFVCSFEDGHIASMELTDDQKKELEDGMTKGEIMSGRSTVSTADIGATVSGDSVTFPKGASVAANASGGHNANPNSNAAEATSRRNLAQLVGNKYTLIVIGRFLDYPFNSVTAASISDDLFGTSGDPVNLKSQLEACSYGKLVTVPEPDPTWNGGAMTSLAGIESAPGVLDIDMGVNMAGMTKTAIFNLFKDKTAEKLGFASAADLPGPFDHILFARETCLSECGWAAYASVNGWYHMYQGGYITQTGVQIHEMGHNLNLAHSGSEGITWDDSGITRSVGVGGYTDHTGMMGNPLYSDDVGQMCFNPAKNYQIDGWYNDAKVVLDPRQNINMMGWTTGPAALPFEGDVVGIGEYDKRAANEPVTIKIETNTPKDYFVGFNRAAGPNSDNDLADDQVNVIQVDGNNGEGYSQSQLRSLLNGAGSYAEYAVPGMTYRGEDVKVKVNSITTGLPYGKANVKIGYEECTNDAFCQTTAGSCFNPAGTTCEGQGAAGTNVFGCVDDPIPDCCGNEICEPGEDATECAVDCLTPEISIQPDNCGGCWIRDGAMFDVEAKADADITIKQINYKAYTNTGNMRVYYRPGGKAGYASGSSLTSNGWIFATQVATCGSTWTMCPIDNLSIPVPRGTTVGLLVTYDNGGDVLYYNNNYGPTSDEFLTVHAGTAVNYNLAGDYANSFHNALMFSGDVIYEADLSPPPPDCTSDSECDDGVFCNGQETCTAGSCQPGTPPSCSEPTPMCSEDLDQCVACLSDGDCPDDGDLCNGSETCNASGQCVLGPAVDCDDGVACTVDMCTPATGSCTNTPNDFECDNGSFCDGAETCDAIAGCQAASDPCTGSTPFCDEVLDQCNECAVDSDCANNNDSNMCNGSDTCVDGTCVLVPGSEISCDDGVACTVDTCEPTTGQCTNTASDAECDDGVFCNGQETCTAGGCQPGTAVSCSEPTPMCSEDLDQCVSCLFDGDCDDGLFCNGQETCTAGVCQPGTAPSCSGPTPLCSEALDSCVECLLSPDCDDGVACTDDVCSGGTCSSTPNDANCPGSETCDAGAGCLNIATVFACSKNPPLEAEACAAGNDPSCTTVGESCGKGGKICHEFSCVVEPAGPTNPPAPTNPPVAAPTNPPVSGQCTSSGGDFGNCSPSNCCSLECTGGKPSGRSCV